MKQTGKKKNKEKEDKTRKTSRQIERGCRDVKKW